MLQNLNWFIKSGVSMFSSPFRTHNGVPQGDPISPLLFSLFTADLPSSLAHEPPLLNGRAIPYLLYADDLVVLADSKEELQVGVDSVVLYCSESNLDINIPKTKVLIFHKGRLPKDSLLYLADAVIPRVNSFCYLGFTFTTQLSWAQHVNKMCVKAKARTAFLFSKLPLAQLPLPVVLMIFRIYVTPIFRYGLFLWLANCPKASLLKIDPVFYKFLKRYLRIPIHSSNGMVHFLTNTEPLSVTLKRSARSSYDSLSFPPLFSGYRP
jgi:hypothetical protein